MNIAKVPPDASGLMRKGQAKSSGRLLDKINYHHSGCILKILFASETNPYSGASHGGAEMSMRVLARELANRGHFSFLVTTKVYGECEKKALEEGVRLIAMPTKFKSRSILIRKLVYRFRMRSLVSAAKKLEPDLMYCSYELNILTALVEARENLSCSRLVMRVAGRAYRDFSLKWPGYKEKFISLSSKVDAINHVHGYLERDYQNFVHETGPRSFLPKSFVCDLASTYFKRPIQSKPGNKNTVSLVMVARFSDYQKRQDLLIEAMSYFDESFPFRLLLVGEGPRKKAVAKRARKLGVEDSVQFLPFLPQDELWKRLVECDLLVHATEHEGRSKIISEAMAAGLPVLASDVPPVNWDIKDGVNDHAAACGTQDHELFSMHQLVGLTAW